MRLTKMKLQTIINEQIDIKEEFKEIIIKWGKDKNGEQAFIFFKNGVQVALFWPDGQYISVDSNSMNKVLQFIFKILNIKISKDIYGGEGKIMNYILTHSGSLKLSKMFIEISNRK